MTNRLRTRLLASSIATVVLVITLIGVLFFAQRQTTADIGALERLRTASRQSRELSLYVQYNAHDTNAYTLGHLEHRQEYEEHTAAFNATLAALEQAIGDDQRFQPQLATIRELRERYTTASLRLFEAADLNREQPTTANQAAEDAAWEESDQLGDQLDEASAELAGLLEAEAGGFSGTLNDRLRIGALLTLVAGLIIVAVIFGLLLRSAQALGRPLQAVLSGLHQIKGGEYGATIPVTSDDEVGELASAVNLLSSTLNDQRRDLEQREEAFQAQLQAQSQLLEVIRELETPAIPLLDGVLLLPLIGNLDSQRAHNLTEALLAAVHDTRSRVVIIDTTGVVTLDGAVALYLNRLIQSVKLLGARVFLTGINSNLALTIAQHDARFDDVRVFGRLQDAIAATLQSGSSRK